MGGEIAHHHADDRGAGIVDVDQLAHAFGKNPRWCAVAQARRWAEAAASAQTPTPLDMIVKRAAIAILPALRANDGKTAAVLARKLLPFGKLAE